MSGSATQRSNFVKRWQSFFDKCQDYRCFGDCLQLGEQPQENVVNSDNEDIIDKIAIPTKIQASENACEIPQKNNEKNTQSNKPEVNKITELSDLKKYLDLVQIKESLLKPYCLFSDYPLVDARELMPSFDVDPYEHKALPGFALVAFQRKLSYFDEVFQYDTLYSENPGKNISQAICNNKNLNVLQQRLQRALHEDLRQCCLGNDLASLKMYPVILKFLLEMDRAQVMAHDQNGYFRLSGINASFPSDLDTEVKRFGLRMGKFSIGDNEKYEQNRSFVMQFLMELYGYPLASERRTSAAIFSRRLHKLQDKFMIRALGQTDRVITSLYNFNSLEANYPQVEKVALVGLDKDQAEAVLELKNGEEFFVDIKRKAVLLRSRYTQHLYSPENVRQDRALSVVEQELIHPYTGQVIKNINILKDSTNMFLRLNDIVRGEFRGRIIYKRQEVIENTDSEEKRLKFLYAWLVKHQRRFISYRDEYFVNVAKLVENYLFNLHNNKAVNYEDVRILVQEVQARFSFIQQARKVKILEDLRYRVFRNERIGYLRMLEESNKLLQELKFEFVTFFEQHIASALIIGEHILNDSYLIRNYIKKDDKALSKHGLQIKKQYSIMVGLLDELVAIKKARLDMQAERNKDKK
ncbi:hypothetical protein [Desulfovibrio litoralis]|uniref:Uncharacterized protein n=1 Tax=Desulfovibrio litoralis DSM 11393 TaxID=1121455 RepID=A0A1M7SX38_9BACT|nr:hypothetical protein [Desulfovibrio litoralis]SHN63039.1 hypothetical protein SAMN02745728_01331 [Desulfovibrio litoralis DSM 11393]